jgi:hypothetical protein
MDPAEVIRSAIESRDLAGARDIASVIDARIRQRVHPLLPQPQGPWSSRVPLLPDPCRQAYLTEIAAMMDDRKQRIGQHIAQHPPLWAIKALGLVPADPAARQEWQNKAASIGGYRETYAYDHPATRSALNPPATRRTSVPPGVRRSSPSARPTGPMSALCPTAGSGSSVTPTPPRPPGRPGTSARKCD